MCRSDRPSRPQGDDLLSGFAELGIADRVRALRPIDVLVLQVECFADAQACDCQKPEQAIIRPGLQPVTCFYAFRRFQQPLDLVIGIEAGLRTRGPVWQQAWKRDLGPRICCAPVPRESAHSGKPGHPDHRV
jgi:hypothetical protein